ncbi:MAG: hypothetical protein HN932_06925 [Candidatus Marinimicrobia bacterium]|jgi:hypothetical protein|nr:hypothetical protein [Candidatus Thioglobus sp.]MBT7090188.1 hypothetical protein [Candidatus Neomarinimicrobiota bacterium]
MREENQPQENSGSENQATRSSENKWQDHILALMLYDPPELKGETAAQLIYFFRELLESLERHYIMEIKEYEKQQNQLDLKLPFYCGKR